MYRVDGDDDDDAAKPCTDKIIDDDDDHSRHSASIPIVMLLPVDTIVVYVRLGVLVSIDSWPCKATGGVCDALQRSGMYWILDTILSPVN
jgi:hypothetical protein